MSTSTPPVIQRRWLVSCREVLVSHGTGEYGYYLTTFVSAVSYIKKVDPAEFGEREEDRKRG